MPRILIVDDSIVARNGTRHLLESKGFEVVDAVNGQDGLDAIEKHKPDCMVLDLLMPEMNGLVMLQELHDRGIKIPVLVHTADVQSSTRQYCKELNCFGFINKPCDSQEILKLVAEMVALNSRDVE